MTERPCLCEANGLCWVCTIWATAKGLGVWRPKVTASEPVKEKSKEPDLFRDLQEEVG